jgi:hypothetical protein
MDDLGVETDGDGIEVVPAPGMKVVEDDLHGCIAHRHLLVYGACSVVD